MELTKTIRRAPRKLRVLLDAQMHNGSHCETERFKMELLQQPRYQDPRRLNHFELRTCSQNGEDGIIEEIFRRIGVESHTFVEIGVGDGLESNTSALLLRGWNGWWFDGSFSKSIKKNLGELLESTLKFTAAWITAENVSDLFRDAGVPAVVDLFSLDIDRNTYWIWNALTEFHPRVIVMEYNPSFPHSVDWVVPYKENRSWNGSIYYGASLLAYQLLGEKYGYKLVGCELTGTNAFFVRSDLCEDHFEAPFTSENHFEPLRNWLSWPATRKGCFDDEYNQ